MGWNHNNHYLGVVLREVPKPCLRALDVGCGKGYLAQKLASRCNEVIAIDRDKVCVEEAAATPDVAANTTFINVDVMSNSLPEDSFDFVAAVATLHHLPLHLALERFRNLLRPGGVLVVIGLYKAATLLDYAWGAMALPISLGIRLTRGEEAVGAPLQAPKETLNDIRRAVDTHLPGAIFRRRLFFRYTVVWRKP